MKIYEVRQGSFPESNNLVGRYLSIDKARKELLDRGFILTESLRYEDDTPENYERKSEVFGKNVRECARIYFYDVTE